MSQQIFLKWNNHTTMIDEFKNLLSAQCMVDVTLACSGKSLKAHKLVLSACSSYFQSLFAENPCKHPIVILKDVKYTELKAIIDFMYNGEVNVTEDRLEDLIKAAEILKVKVLGDVMIADESENPPSVGIENDSANVLENQTNNDVLPNQTGSVVESQSDSVMVENQSDNIMVESPSANVEIESQSDSVEIESQPDNVENENQSDNVENENQSDNVEIENQSDNATYERPSDNVPEHPSKNMPENESGDVSENKTAIEAPVHETKPSSPKKKKGRPPKRVSSHQNVDGVPKCGKRKAHNVGTEKLSSDMEMDVPVTLPLPSHSTSSLHKPHEENMNLEDSEPHIASKSDDSLNNSKKEQNEKEAPELSWNLTSTPFLPASFVVLRDVMSLINESQEKVKTPKDLPYIRLESKKEPKKISKKIVCQPVKLQKHKARADSPSKKDQESTPRSVVNDDSSSQTVINGDPSPQKVINGDPSSSRVVRDDSSPRREPNENSSPKSDLNEGSSPKSDLNKDSSPKTDLNDDSPKKEILNKIENIKDPPYIRIEPKTTLKKNPRKIVTKWQKHKTSGYLSSSKVSFLESPPKEVLKDDLSPKTDLNEDSSPKRKFKDYSTSKKVLSKIENTQGWMRVFRCNKCSFKTIYGTSIKRHILMKHEKIKRFKCYLCPYEATLKQNFLRHVEEVHENVMRFQCTMCPYKSAQHGNMKRHIKVVHERNKCFKCDKCSFRSAQKSSIQKHVMAVHERKRNFMCPFCTYRCALRGNLKRHMIGRHDFNTPLE